MTVCMRCGRVLTTTTSQRLGYGPVCWAKVGAYQQDAVVKLPFDRRTMDVTCRRSPNGIAFNIPHVLVVHSPTGMEWGYEGSGPADFALNILYQFTRNKRFALEWYQDFKREFVATIPYEGGTISGARILRWIKSRRGLKPAQALLLPMEDWEDDYSSV